MATTLHIVEACRKTTPRRRDEPLEQYLARLTHLNLSQRHLSAVGDIAHCHRLMVLYLYQNNLSQLRGLRSCAHLTQLYLQDNALERLDGLSTLTHLTKLYIGGNRLVVLEGLHNLHKLRELHAERQELPPGEELILDPRSLRTAQRQLEVLNLEHNGLTSLHSLHGFQKLRTLRLGGNHLAHLHVRLTRA
ncbi:uncharacterized protein MONBRDRAFT_16779 [Monosiga brevicollis MX1]|uniref:Protein phosphatase 1 regulatory subunit 42 n=1 Tax=Monosiga brevicollis TaxID=81824 RepID=A9UY98_MONBE|nr:uncharacterized protein MONBRDRAFT_16779 [Monosiga brevicollis MX1]EDQ89985.1 predicted protein [Monosiga brevicollis MX1]|eukprot:XP_001745407.1 hypothetical protein [Monosiga brevicollis MX1]